MHRNLIRYTALPLVLALFAVAAPRTISAHPNSVAALAQPANDGNDPGGGGTGDPDPCSNGFCVAR